MNRSALIAALAVALTAPTVLEAQGGPGFLFKRPVFSVGVRVGYAVPRTGGQLFDQTLDAFIPLGADTTSSLSFNSPYLGGEIAFKPSERVDIALNIGWMRSRTLTEYRRFVEEISPTQRVPIQQETTYQVVTSTLGAKYYLWERGRRVGSLAWVPQRLTPFVGAGVGFSSYDFRQVGDFVDVETFEIFNDWLESSDEGLAVYASAGADLTLWKNAFLTAEARYTYSKADVQYPFDGFQDIDLAGLQLLAGIGFQF